MKWLKLLRKDTGRKENTEEAGQGKDSTLSALALPCEPSSDHARVEALSPRERQVFIALLAGKKQREIAEMLGVKPTTVSFHCTALYKKLDIHDKAHLFLRYARFVEREHENGAKAMDRV